MARKRSDDAPRMSPLARRLQTKSAEMPYREMERFVWDQRKIRFTSSSFERIAKDQRADRLTATAIKAVALVLGISEPEVADLDDQRWGITRRHVAHAADASHVYTLPPHLASRMTPEKWQEALRVIGAMVSGDE